MMYLSDRKMLIVILAIVALTLIMQVFVKRDESGTFGVSMPKLSIKPQVNSTKTT